VKTDHKIPTSAVFINIPYRRRAARLER